MNICTYRYTYMYFIYIYMYIYVYIYISLSLSFSLSLSLSILCKDLTGCEANESCAEPWLPSAVCSALKGLRAEGSRLRNEPPLQLAGLLSRKFHQVTIIGITQ